MKDELNKRTYLDSLTEISHKLRQGAPKEQIASDWMAYVRTLLKEIGFADLSLPVVLESWEQAPMVFDGYHSQYHSDSFDYKEAFLSIVDKEKEEMTLAELMQAHVCLTWYVNT